MKKYIQNKSADPITTATSIATVLLKAGYSRIKASNMLIKGGYNSYEAIAALNKSTSAMAGHAPGTVYVNINDKSHLDALVTILDKENDKIIRKSGAGDKLLQESIMGIESANTIPERCYSRLRDLNIILQK